MRVHQAGVPERNGGGLRVRDLRGADFDVRFAGSAHIQEGREDRHSGTAHGRAGEPGVRHEERTRVTSSSAPESLLFFFARVRLVQGPDYDVIFSQPGADGVPRPPFSQRLQIPVSERLNSFPSRRQPGTLF